MPSTPRIGRNSPVLGVEREKLAMELKSLYEKGSSVRDLAGLTSRSYGTIHRLLKEAGVEFRSRQ